MNRSPVPFVTTARRRLAGFAVILFAFCFSTACSPSHPDNASRASASASATPSHVTAPSLETATDWNGITMPRDAVAHDRGSTKPGERLVFFYKRGWAPAWAERGGIERWIYARSVRNIQQRVGVPADGIYGPVTEQAVKDSQFLHGGLVVDGEVGPQTSRALGLRWDYDVDYA